MPRTNSLDSSDPAATAGGGRTILFLQGPPSGFWRELAAGFRARGARVLRINLCAGDILYWLSPRSRIYFGRRADWPAWLSRLIDQHAITDILYFGDRHPYHASAAEVAQERGVNHYVVEFGYLRPGWLTLERGGMGTYSHFPADPEIIRHAARELPPPDESGDYGHSWVWESFHEIVFNVTNLLYRPIFWNYDPDRFYSAIPEYVSGAMRHLRRLGRRNAYAHIEAQCASGDWPYFVYALQLQSDWQIRANSPFTDQLDALGVVLASMAAHAPKDMRLIVKCHPLDAGMIDWPSEIARLAERNGVADRVLYIDGGDLQTLLRASEGVILINSTVGLQALQMGVPVHAMGVAVYDMPGLTHQSGIDAFWQRPAPVDDELCDCLVRLLAASIQLRGSFFNRAGKTRAVEEIVSRVLGDRVNQPDAFVDPPPRLASAAALGVEVDRETAS
jgi:capsular polysaccharide export protein